MLDVLVLTRDDWAGTGYRFAKCLKSLGLNVLMLKGANHRFNPGRDEAPLHPSLLGSILTEAPRVVQPLEINGVGLKELVESARVVHFTASTYVDVKTDWTRRKVVVQHGGRTYRNAPGKANELFNRFSDATIIQCPDLLGLGAKNEHLIYYPVDTEAIQPWYEPMDDVPLIGHYPSHAPTKGSKAIFRVLEKLRAEGLKFKYAEEPARMMENTTWAENIARVKLCDIYIETLAPECDGRPYGEWGNAALEAAASGCAVVTNCLSADVYEREYGHLGLYVANDAAELEAQVRKLLGFKPDMLKVAKKQSREWVVANHSMEATAKRLWEKAYKELLDAPA